MLRNTEILKLWTAARQAPLFMGFFRQEYWTGLPFSPAGDVLDPGIKPTSPALQSDSLPLSHEKVYTCQLQSPNLSLPPFPT